jgi:hypothetical protein
MFLSIRLSILKTTAMTQVIIDRLQLGPATSKELQDHSGLSQAAVSRQIRALGDRVVRLSDRRPPLYILACDAFGGGSRHPLYMVDPHGNNSAVAIVRPLAHGGYYVQRLTGMPRLLLGVDGTGMFDGLPYFLEDLRPQGFLGRQVAEEISLRSPDFPTDPRRWNDDHIGRYLISNGDDLPGNFKFGQYAHLRVRHQHESHTPDDYPMLADRVMSGVVPGSSAGGEQPKFTTYCSERSAHVIVKFTPIGDDAIARRWRDILVTEFHATEAIHDRGFPAAETRLLERDGRLFLESIRFDRSGDHGRLPLISLQSVDAEFTGLGTNWPQVMYALYQNNLVSWEHVFDAEFLWCFGRFINNTDMHLGNLSLMIEGSVFRILPVYDMCSMGFAPKSAEVPSYRFDVPTFSGLALGDESINRAREMAHDFWNRVANDPLISSELREFLAAGNPMDSNNESLQGDLEL